MPTNNEPRWEFSIPKKPISLLLCYVGAGIALMGSMDLLYLNAPYITSAASFASTQGTAWCLALIALGTWVVYRGFGMSGAGFTKKSLPGPSWLRTGLCWAAHIVLGFTLSWNFTLDTGSIDTLGAVTVSLIRLTGITIAIAIGHRLVMLCIEIQHLNAPH